MHTIQLIFFIAYFSILGALIVLLLRQKESYFMGVKRLFIHIFLAFAIMGFLDLTKNHLVRTETAVFFTTAGSVSAILWAFIVVGLFASILSEGSLEKVSLRGLYSKWFFSKNLNFPLFIYTVYATIMVILTWVFAPWRAQLVRNIWGDLVYIPVFELWYLVCLLVLFIAFVSYPCLRVIISSRNYKEKGVAQALRWLGLCWAGTSFSVFLFSGLCQLLGFEMIEFGYALDITFFGIIAYLFKKTTILAGFFETMHPSTLVDKENIDLFSRKLEFKHSQLVGRKILLEFDPTSNYEKAIQDFVTEALANAEPIAMFTRKGSAIHSVLSKRKGFRLLYLTQQVSVPTVGASENEILLPINNASLLLETLNNAMDANPHNNISIVFDNLSELLLSNGFEKIYSFMRYAIEMLSSSRVTALFLLNPNAHDPKVTSSLRNLFSNQVTNGKDGLQVIKLHKSS